MISRRFLSNSSSHFAKASLRHLPFLVSHQIRHLSAKPRFDFGGIREPKDATALFQEMLRMRPLPLPPLALHLFHHMLRIDAPVDGYSLNIAINCFCCVKRPDFGFAVLGSFFKRGYEPDVVSFNTLMKGLMLVGKIQEAAKLLGKLLAEQVCYPNEVTYHTIINGLCKAGHTLDALDLLGSFEKGGCKPNVFRI